jgi:hypothetical protein
MHNNEQQYMGLNERLTAMDAKIDRGPPGLWKLTKQVAEQVSELSVSQGVSREGGREGGEVVTSECCAKPLVWRDGPAHVEVYLSTCRLLSSLQATELAHHKDAIEEAAHQLRVSEAVVMHE